MYYQRWHVRFGGSVQSNLPELTANYLSGQLPTSSQCFVVCLLQKGVRARASSHSNVPCRPVSPFVTVIRGGSVYSNLPYRAGSSELVAVRPHRTSWDHCDERGGRPTGKVRVSLGWFDYTEPLRTTVLKGEAGLLGRF